MWMQLSFDLSFSNRQHLWALPSQSPHTLACPQQSPAYARPGVATTTGAGWAVGAEYGYAGAGYGAYPGATAGGWPAPATHADNSRTAVFTGIDLLWRSATRDDVAFFARPRSNIRARPLPNGRRRAGALALNVKCRRSRSTKTFDPAGSPL